MIYINDSVVGHIKGKAVKFSDLEVEIQIALQNSEKWEKWQQTAVDLQGRNEGLGTKIRDLVRDLERTCIENRELNGKVSSLLLYLSKISQKVDSLAWAKEVAEEGLEKNSDEYDEEEIE